MNKVIVNNTEYYLQEGVTDFRMKLKDGSDLKVELVSDGKLPSRYQINDLVAIKFKDFFVKEAKVIKVHFSESKVLYDLEIKMPWQDFDGKAGGNSYTRIYNVDSVIVENL